MSERLFDIDSVPVISTEELVNKRGGKLAPILGLLGVSEVNHEGQYQPYVRVKLKNGYKVLQCGTRMTTTYSNSKGTLLGGEYSWGEWETIDSREVCGFAAGLPLLNSQILLHLHSNNTDVDISGLAVNVEAIEELYVYEPNYTDVMNAFQNADHDGDTYMYQRHIGLPLEVSLAPKEIEPFIHLPWARQRLVFPIGANVSAQYKV